MDRRKNISKKRSRSGQAMTEFLVGLVSIMLLVAGLYQIALISKGTFKAHFNMRRALALQMMGSGSGHSGQYVFPANTDPGPDGKRHTTDDYVVDGKDGFLSPRAGVRYAVDYSSVDGYLDQYNRNNPYSNLAQSSFSPAGKRLQMLYATDRQSIEITPFLRRIFDLEAIEIEQSGWMPALDKVMQ